jgi:hypothetical protein
MLQERLEVVYVTSVIGGCMVLQRLGAGGNGCHEFVCGGEARVGDVLVVKLYGVTEAFVVGGLDVAAVRTVVFRGGIEVPTVNRVECPGPS